MVPTVKIPKAMERLKQLAENLITQANNEVGKQHMLETVIEMIRVLSADTNTTQFPPEIQSFGAHAIKSVETSPLPTVVESLSLNEVLRGVEEDFSARLNQSSIHSLREAIGINERFVYTDKLFGNSIVRFEKVIDLMDRAGSYEASEQVLIDELTMNMPDDAAPAIVDQLLSLVRRRFATK